ncbi:MAG: hypothetical protein ACI9J3_002986 [Parvicellaceae bacterium]|jgi:hypothetical protein
MTDVKEVYSVVDRIEWDLGTIELRSDNILLFYPYEHVKGMSVDQLKIMLSHLKKITKGIPRPFFSHNYNMTDSLTTDAKLFIAKHCHEFATAFAISEQHAITRFIAHSIMYLHKPAIPMKLFKSEKSALEWLKKAG